MDISRLPVWFVPDFGDIVPGFFLGGLGFVIGTFVVTFSLAIVRPRPKSLVVFAVAALFAIADTVFGSGYGKSVLFLYVLTALSVAVIAELVVTRREHRKAIHGIAAVGITSCYYIHLLCALASSSV